MRIVVQKFGGSSLSSPEKRKAVLERIRAAVDGGRKAVVVVSAMGRMGDEFATDSILGRLDSLVPEPLPEQRDLVASTGELYSLAAMSSLAVREGLRAAAFSGFDLPLITDCDFGDAAILGVGTLNLMRALRENDVVFVAGFQGVSREGFVTTLGRGGSDTTAAALASALGADCAEIYTDVDGVRTVDPRDYPEAPLISGLDYMEMGEMASEGAKVLHTRCVEIAERGGLDLFVRNSFSDAPGTIISSSSGSGRVVSGFIHRAGISDFCADYSLVNNAPKRQGALFEALADGGISLDMINVCGKRVFFSVFSSDSGPVKRYFSVSGIKYTETGGVAKISCVGSGMKGVPGVMASVFRVLSEAGVRVHRIVDSFINISFLISESDSGRALSALHGLLDADPADRKSSKL